jgi:NinB protein
MISTAFEIVLTDDRTDVHEKIDSLEDGSRVTFRRPLRSLHQNAHLWALLADISRQVVWYGEMLSAEDWKNVATASLRKSRTVPTIDGDGLVPLGLYTSEMSDEEMSNLIALLHAFGDQQGVKWKAYRSMEAQAAAQRTARKDKPK